MWGSFIEVWGKKDVDSSGKELDFIDNDSTKLFDNDFDRLFVAIIQNLDMEMDHLQK